MSYAASAEILSRGMLPNALIRASRTFYSIG
jgi:hypothetical protein